MNIPWDLIIEAVIEMVQKCLASDQAQPVRERLHAPRPLDWLRLRSGLFRRGLRGRDLDAAMQAARKHCCTPTGGDEDWADELIQQATSTK